MSAGGVLDDLFHACALAAFVERARVDRGWPDSEATRLLACRLYEAALAEKNRRGSAPGAGPPPPVGPAEPAADTHT